MTQPPRPRQERTPYVRVFATPASLARVRTAGSKASKVANGGKFGWNKANSRGNRGDGEHSSPLVRLRAHLVGEVKVLSKST